MTRYPASARPTACVSQLSAVRQQQLRAPIFEDKVVDLIAEKAKVEEKTVTKAELEKAVEALDEL